LWKNVARFMLERLDEWGVRRIYGYPGDGINAMLGAFHEVEDRVEFVQTAHEELAAFAATAHAKLTDEVGVCMATSGSGAVHLLNGHLPTLNMITGPWWLSSASRRACPSEATTCRRWISPTCSRTWRTSTSRSAWYRSRRHLIDRAIRIAKATRSVTCIIVPDDVAESDYEEPPRKRGAVFSGGGFPALPRLVPEDEDLRRAAEVLNAGQKVSMLIDAGARHVAEEVKEVPIYSVAAWPRHSTVGMLSLTIYLSLPGR
jgi:pyruvate dehydrogenase (quinone)